MSISCWRGNLRWIVAPAVLLGLVVAGTAQDSPPKLAPLKIGILKMAALTNSWVAK